MIASATDYGWVKGSTTAVSVIVVSSDCTPIFHEPEPVDVTWEYEPNHDMRVASEPDIEAPDESDVPRDVLSWPEDPAPEQRPSAVIGGAQRSGAG